MTARILVGRDPATCVIRQEVVGRNFDYFETVLDEDAIALMLYDLAMHHVRVKQYLRTKRWGLKKQVDLPESGDSGRE